jgi:hypothetical protein
MEDPIQRAHGLPLGHAEKIDSEANMEASLSDPAKRMFPTRPKHPNSNLCQIIAVCKCGSNRKGNSPAHPRT